jgi:Fe-S cluster assembly iron-binding protein IscA
MLQIAEDAVDAFKEIGPIRIRGIESDGEVELEIEEAGEQSVDDQLVERDGARILLDPVAASALDDQVIGVHAHGDHFHFTFDEQDSEDESR